ncbi:efflux RND transporter permease subunit [Simkania sp.]|uniref:efflux RND transporter permease subunit n=1 Tax=Simkania sp. TaxID=34094 RepID=UPI003B52BF15
MNLSEIFIRRPVMTCLVMATILFFGILGYKALPVSDLPDVSFPTIEVTTSYPGASPDTMADTVTSPLERQFTSIDGILTISSSSTNGNSTIVLQFVLDKDIDSAAQDVEAAINRATPNLPDDLPSNPTYKKTNPTETPVLYYAIKSDSMTLGDLYEYAYSLMGRRLGMVEGVSDVDVYGSPFAVRVQVDPDKLAAHQIGIDQIANAVVKSNPQKPVGNLYGPDVEYTIDVDGQMHHAAGYNELIVRNNNHALVKIKDLGHALDSLQNDKYSLNYYTADSKTPCVIIAILKQNTANTIKVIQGCEALLDKMKDELPGSVDVVNLFDQSVWIMESVDDVQFTLFIAFLLVVVVVLFYLGKFIDTIIPILALPMSVVGTFAMMYLYGFNIDIFSLLAITLSIGFLVDDAIVVLENITRHVEMGKNTWEAALNGSKQISFTILSMTLSLCSVFIPMIFMAGIMGRIFREFAITIVTAVLISGFISLSLTPMLCSKFVGAHTVHADKNWIERFSDKINGGLQNIYKRGLNFVFKHRFSTLCVGIASVILTLVLGLRLPTDFLPSEDLGFIQGFGISSDSTSPFKMIEYQEKVAEIVRSDPNVLEVVSAAAIPTSNQSLFFIKLKDYNNRMPMRMVIRELLGKLHEIPGIQAFMRPLPLLSLDVGTGISMGNYQYVVTGLDSQKMYEGAEEIMVEMRKTGMFSQVTSDMHNNAPYANIKIDRDRAYDLNVTAEGLEYAFDYAYAGGEISLINSVADQYYVIVETLPKDYGHVDDLNKLYISASSQTPLTTLSQINTVGETFPTQIPLSEIVKIEEGIGPLSVAHLNTLPSATITFDTNPGVPLGTAIQELTKISDGKLAPGITASVQGSADIFKQTFQSMGFLFVVTLFLIYVILGILYENLVHPITVMSTLPPAGLGAILTLLIFGLPLSLYAFVGLIMVLGIVLKNGIMIVDFANEGINEGKNLHEAIYEACLARFRPILMTTFAAMMGAVPIALGVGGLTAQSRIPLGLVIVGGLTISQVLTLFFTPVVFTYLESIRERVHERKRRKKTKNPDEPEPSGPES